MAVTEECDSVLLAIESARVPLDGVAMKAFHKPYDRMTSRIRPWFQFRLRTLLCIMTLFSFAFALSRPVIRPWLESFQQKDAEISEIDIDAVIRAIKRRIPAGSAKEIRVRPYGSEDATGAPANANDRPNHRR